MIDRVALAEELRHEEGTGPINNGRLMPYRDSVGLLTIGYGRCIERVGITKSEAEYLLMSDIHATIAAVEKALPWFSRLDGIRQRVLINVAFNAGTHGLLGFKDMLAACQRGDYDVAADELLDSEAARTTAPSRYIKLARMMRTGEVV